MTTNPVEPFHHSGGETAVLLIHGFTGSPAAMRPWAEFLADHDCTVSLPVLPGHATSWQEMAKTSWQDWYAGAEQAFDELRAQHDRVFLCALSMGGTLSLRLAEQRGDEVAGLTLVNPSFNTPKRLDAKLAPLLDRLGLINLLAKVMPAVPAISNDIAKPGQDEMAYPKVPTRSGLELLRLQDVVRRDVARIDQPIRVLWSPQDHVVEQGNAQAVIEGVSSTDKRLIRLDRSYHVATLDYDADVIHAESLTLIRDVAGG